MTKSSIECTFREAIPDDAEQLLDFIAKTRSQTNFLTDNQPLNITVEEQAQHLANIYDAEGSTLILAFSGDRIVGSSSIYAYPQKWFQHIGILGVSVDKDYWGFGLGTILTEEALAWAENSKYLKRIELKVYQNNERAIHIYNKLDFKLEAEMAYGAKVEGEYQTVLMMSKIFQNKS